MNRRLGIAILAGLGGFVAAYYAVLFYTDIQWQQHPFDVNMGYFVLRNTAPLYAGMGGLLVAGIILALASGIAYARRLLPQSQRQRNS